MCVPLCRPVHHADPGAALHVEAQGFWAHSPAWPMPTRAAATTAGSLGAGGPAPATPARPWPGRAGQAPVVARAWHNLEGPLQKLTVFEGSVPQRPAEDVAAVAWPPGPPGAPALGAGHRPRPGGDGLPGCRSPIQAQPERLGTLLTLPRPSACHPSCSPVPPMGTSGRMPTSWGRHGAP